MRLLGRLLLLLILACAAAFLYPPLRALFQVPPPAPALAQQLDLTARPSTVFFLPEDDWLTFPVISQAARLRILTHAGASPGTEVEVPLRYALEYEILDGSGNLLHQGRYIHATQIPQPLFKNGVPIARNLYTDRSVVVAGGQSINMQLEALPRTAFVRLRLQPLAAPLENVAVRVYYEERMSERQASVAWGRVSQAKKERLAQGAIYPPELLTQRERLNLLERQWQPVGPLGTDPAQGTLFIIEGTDPLLDPDLIPRSPSLYVAPDRMGVIPVQTAGRYLVQFKPLATDANLQPELELGHITEQFELPRKEVVRLTGESLTVEQMLSAGLLLVTPNQPGMLDIWPAEALEQSVLPEPRFLRARVVRPGHPVHFQLLPGDDIRTSLRLDLRAHGDGAPLPEEKLIQVRYRMLDAQDKVIDEHSLEASVRPSIIDRVADSQPVADLSEPASFYLRLPPEAARIELISSQRVLVNAYTRPDDLPHRTRVPVDYYPWRGDDTAQPGWFILQPAISEEPATQAQTPTEQESDASVVLHLQSRPPQRDTDLLAGRYQWEALDPQLSARGAQILIPLRGEEQLRPSGLPGYFQPIRQGTQVVEIAAPGVARPLEPKLVYLREDSSPFNLQLRIDGTTVRHELIGRRGEIRMPPMLPGRHEVELDASTKATWLMNYRYPDDSGYLLRMAFRLDAAPLRYPVHKREDGQLIGARFYSLGEVEAESTVRVRIVPAALKSGPAREWTHLERRYQITPSAEETRVGYVLGQQRERVSLGQPILIDLGDDLPNGNMEVEFSLHSGAAGYIVFYEILPGQHERARSFRQEDE